MRAATAIALLLAAAPALAQPRDSSVGKPADRQPIVNILRGSLATPGGVALLTLAEESLARAKAAADRQDAAAVGRELRASSGDDDSGAFVRALAAIAANAALAGYSRTITPADAARIGDCADGLADAAEAPAPDIERLRIGTDANGDGAVTWSLAECGLLQLRQIITQAASATGL